MKRKTSKKLVGAISAAAICCLMGGALAVNANMEANAESTFVMVGAQVRMSEPTGLRFVSKISKAKYEEYTNPVCGTLILPSSKLSEAETLTLTTSDVLNIPTVNWLPLGEEEVASYKSFAGVLVGASTAEGEAISYDALPEEYWNISFASVGYIYEKGDNSSVLYTNQLERTLAEVAAYALADSTDTNDKTYLKTICDTVVGNGLSFNGNTDVTAYMNGESVDLKTLLTGNQGLQAVWTSSDEEVATVVNGVVTAKKTGTVTVTATIGTKTASLRLNVVNVSYNETTGVISWNTIDGATQYVVTVRRQQQTTDDANYTVTTTSCNLWLEQGLNLITVTAKNADGDELAVFNTTVDTTEPIEQSFGELKAGTTNEYYIAEWSNIAEWGQFSAVGYSGGPKNGVKFDYNNNLACASDSDTRVKDGYLQVKSTAWKDGALGFKLPTALDMSTVQSINLIAKATFENQNRTPVFYYNERNDLYYTNSGNNSVTKTTDSEGWTTYSIDVSAIAGVSISELKTLYFGGSNAFTAQIKEITYTTATHGKTMPEGALFITDFSKGVTFEHQATSISEIATTSDELSSVDGVYSGSSVKEVTFTNTWDKVGLTLTFNSPIKFNVNTHSLILQSAVAGLVNDTQRPVFFYNARQKQYEIDEFRQDGFYSLDKNNYTRWGLTPTDGILTIESLTLASSSTSIAMYLDCLYLLENAELSIPEGAKQVVDVSDSSTYTLAAKQDGWVAKSSATTDGLGHSALVNTLAYSWNDAKQQNQFINFSNALDMTNYETIYIAADFYNIAEYNCYIRQGDKFCSFNVTKANGLTVYSVSKSALESAGLDVTKIDGLSFSFKVGTFYVGGVWVK